MNVKGCAAYKKRRIYNKLKKGLKLRKLILFLLLTMVAEAGPRFSVPLSFRLRAYVPAEYHAANVFKSTWNPSVSIRPNWTAGKWNFGTGFDMSQINAGRYDLTSRSFIGWQLHFGVTAFYQVKAGKVRYHAGVFIRRFMNMANDLPAGPENYYLHHLNSKYKADNPGARFPYYNQYGPGVLAAASWFKAEAFAHVPLKLPVIGVIPSISVGKIPVAVGFVLAEFYSPLGVIVRGDWEIHSPGGSYARARIVRDGTGGAIVRRAVYAHSAGEFYAGLGWRKQMDMTGAARSSGYYLEMRFER